MKSIASIKPGNNLEEIKVWWSDAALPCDFFLISFRSGNAKNGF